MLAFAASLLTPVASNPAPVVKTPPPPPLDAFGDDIFLINSSTSPNVVLLLDNSLSMRNIEWHPAFDPDQGTYGCDGMGNNCCDAYTGIAAAEGTPAGEPVEVSTDLKSETYCGNTRDIFAPDDDPFALWDELYLNWYFSDEADPYVNDIETAVAQVEGCTKAGGAKPYAEKYRRTRLEASKQVLLDLLCVAEPKNVRFALATFRETEDTNDEDPNGGYIVSDLGRSNPSHAAELEAAIKVADVNDDDVEATPLAETLFQISSYWMSRTAADIPFGEDGITKFPPYRYDKFGDVEGNSGLWFEDPLLFDCEKAFVVIVTDGSPSRDDLDVEDTAGEADGYAEFDDLIGNYHADAETEVPAVNPDEASYYLDDVAMYMYENDIRPDLGGDQTVDTYTIGLATDAATDDLLERTATLSNGLFFHVDDGDQLTIALIGALNDIIEKSASFTAASVPSARTIDGGDFYQSYFFPLSKSAFWEGHIRAWKIAANGDVLDKNDVCALDDPDVGECNSGFFKSDAEFFWDAADEIPSAGSRKLYVSTSSA
jgi:hypothetical protein